MHTRAARAETAQRRKSNTPGHSKSKAASRSIPGQRHYAAAADLRKIILGEHPDSPVGDDSEWKRVIHGWARSAAAAERRSRKLDELLGLARNAIPNRFIITSFAELVRKEAKIRQFVANENKTNAERPAKPRGLYAEIERQNREMARRKKEDGL
ncbi:MAG: hypothetical protein ACE5H0_12525 [Bacteroidota bacterium]